MLIRMWFSGPQVFPCFILNLLLASLLPSEIGLVHPGKHAGQHVSLSGCSFPSSSTSQFNPFPSPEDLQSCLRQSRAFFFPLLLSPLYTFWGGFYDTVWPYSLVSQLLPAVPQLLLSDTSQSSLFPLKATYSAFSSAELLLQLTKKYKWCYISYSLLCSALLKVSYLHLELKHLLTTKTYKLLFNSFNDKLHLTFCICFQY